MERVGQERGGRGSETAEESGWRERRGWTGGEGAVEGEEEGEGRRMSVVAW